MLAYVTTLNFFPFSKCFLFSRVWEWCVCVLYVYLWYMHMSVCVYMCVSCSVTLCLAPLIKGTWGSQQAPVILPPFIPRLLPWYWGYKYECDHTQILICMLGIWTRVLMLTGSVSQLNVCEDFSKIIKMQHQNIWTRPSPHFWGCSYQHDTSPGQWQLPCPSLISAGSRQYLGTGWWVQWLFIDVTHQIWEGSVEASFARHLLAFTFPPLNMWVWSLVFLLYLNVMACVGSWVWVLAWLDSENKFIPDFWSGVYKMTTVSSERVYVILMLYWFFKHLVIFFPIYWHFIFLLRNQSLGRHGGGELRRQRPPGLWSS